MPRFSIFRHDPATTPQIGYSWYNNGQFIHQDCGFGPPIPCKIVLSDGTVIAPKATNLLLANGAEVWCYVEYIKGADPVTGSPYYDSFGRVRLNTFPAAISPEGDIWITPFTNLDATILTHDGKEIPLGLVNAWGQQLLSGGRRLWMQGYQVQANFEMKGHPVAEGCYGVRCAEDGTALYQMLGGALVLGGHIIAPPSNNYNNPDVILIDGTYWVTYALTTADIPIPDPLHFTQAELDALPLAVNAPPAPVYPQILRDDLYMGWFQFGSIRPGLPANCELWATTGEIWDHAEFDVAQFVENPANEGSLDALNAEMAKSPTLPVPWVPYWTRGMQRGPLPTPPKGAAMVVGLEGYKFNDESFAQWEARLRAGVAKIVAGGRTVALIAQCYTSNTLLEQDLNALIPTYVHLCNTLPAIQMLLIFSGSGRATGYQDHPEVHPAWEAAFSGITGVAHLPRPHYIPDPPDPPTPTPTPEPDMIAFGPVLNTFTAADTIVDNHNGTVSVKQTNGKYLCINPQGGVEERDTPGGAWESFFMGAAGLIAYRDQGNGTFKTFVLPLVR